MKKKTELKAFLIASTILHFTFYTLHSYAATINQVIVRQQWPWSKDVKVEYSLTGVDASHPVDLTVTAYNGDTSLTIANPTKSIKGDLYGITEEFGEFYIDPVAAFGSERIAMTKFKVKIAVSDSAANVNEVLYKIYDLEGGGYTDVTRADLLNGKYGSVETDFGAIGTGFTTSLDPDDVIIWTGVTNYPGAKTTKLVMRKIAAKNKSFHMGSYSPGSPDPVQDYTHNSADEFYFEMTLTNDYWIGVFELTKKQYDLIASANTATEENAACPAWTVDTYSGIRGTPADWTGWSADIYAVSSESLIQKCRTKIPGVKFDLPTEAQWEYACRAGSAYQYHVGYRTGAKATCQTAVQMIANCSENGNGGAVAVGSYLPNAFGLYDMLGNVSEATRDLFDPSTGTVNGTQIVLPPLTAAATDPAGWLDAAAVTQDSACGMLFRGGNWSRDYTWCRCPSRREGYLLTGHYSSRFGLRLWAVAD